MRIAVRRLAKNATEASTNQGWGRAIKSYNATSAYTAAFAPPLAAAVTEKLGDVSKRQFLSLLDMAAGNGEASFRISNALVSHCQAHGGAKVDVVATDFSSDMLALCQSNLFGEDGTAAAQRTKAAIEAGALTFRTEVADAQDHSAFADESFDLITCLFGLMFPPDPQKVVREYWRLLKPGGVAAVGVWHYNSIVEDVRPDLALAFFKQEKNIDLLPPSARFGREGLLRSLFRSSKVWTDEDLEVRVGSATVPRVPDDIAAELNSNPNASFCGQWDEGAALEYLKKHWVNKDGMLEARGTALIMTAVKPLRH